MKKHLLAIRFDSAFGAALISAVAAWACIHMTIVMFTMNYVTGLFVGVPFGMGIIASAIYGCDKPHAWWKYYLVSYLGVFLLGLILLASAHEGLVCLLMALPIAFAFASVGVLIVSIFRRRLNRPLRAATISIIMAFVMPLTIVAESSAHLQATEFPVLSTIEINAPPDTVWKNLVSFPPAPPPHELPFLIGIAYPIEAKLHGPGRVGAMRSCEFSTGSFIETIDVWDPGKRMEFSIAAGADPMTEMTPYPSIHPPHLDGYFMPRHAVFTLTPLSAGRTRLDGVSYYRHAIWPEDYWRVWSDYILHSIHRRVFEHVKQLSEAQ